MAQEHRPPIESGCPDGFPIHAPGYAQKLWRRGIIMNIHVQACYCTSQKMAIKFGLYVQALNEF